MFVRWNPFSKSRELTSAQGLNIAGFEFGCAINVNFDRVQIRSGEADQDLRERVRLVQLSRRLQL
jgi:hypothetical protein